MSAARVNIGCAVSSFRRDTTLAPSSIVTENCRAISRRGPNGLALVRCNRFVNSASIGRSRRRKPEFQSIRHTHRKIRSSRIHRERRNAAARGVPTPPAEQRCERAACLDGPHIACIRLPHPATLRLIAQPSVRNRPGRIEPRRENADQVLSVAEVPRARLVKNA